MMRLATADEEVARQAPWNVGERRHRPWVQVLCEEPLLHEVDERPGSEDAHELVEHPQHRRQDRPASERVHREPPEPARHACPVESPSEAKRFASVPAFSEQRPW